MKQRARRGIVLILMALISGTALADDSFSNRGNDPFFQISSGIAQCPIPLGPLETEQEWLGESHHRIERGNSCWIEGRCRLFNGYLYDAEIADTVQRRLRFIDTRISHWRDDSSLWLVLQRRLVFVQGCVSPDFDKAKFLFELSQTADVDKVIDDTTTDPHAPSLPYRTQADPLKPPTDTEYLQ
jgi:hypothetical protein